MLLAIVMVATPEDRRKLRDTDYSHQGERNKPCRGSCGPESMFRLHLLLLADAIEYRSKALPLRWVDGLHPANPPIQVRSEAGMGYPVLTLRALTNAVVERGLEPVEITPPHV